MYRLLFLTISTPAQEDICPKLVATASVLHFPGSRVDCGYDGLYVTVRVDKWLALVTDFSNLRQACYDLKVLALEVIAKNS